MTAFCVFWVSRNDCLKVAEKQVSLYDKETKERLSIGEWKERVSALAADIFTAKARVKQISPAFDTPHFCSDWIDVAAKTGQIRLQKIMARGAKTDKNGAPVKRNGKPVITWLLYEAETNEVLP